jgi:endo-1,4-beta-D-glucanase Y
VTGAPTPGRRRRRGRRTLLAIVVLLGVPALALAALHTSGSDPPQARARAAAEDFLDRYVEPDGRVVRRDQGGDTVSEGQAYAMLLAAAARDRRRFATIWRWTRENLQRPDGLLAWRWTGGRVTDFEPATDADLDAARALLVAARRFRVPGYRFAAHRIARGVLRSATTYAADKLVLVAGPWARPEAVINPSYASPRTFRALHRATGDARWRRLAASSRRLTARLTERPPHVPPDWARVEPWGVLPTAPPARGGAASYGYDAVRVPVRLAESCVAADHRMAARMWAALRAAPGAPVRALDGTRPRSGEHPAALVGAAAAAAAAGDRRARDRLLDRAGALDSEHPTYYGAAWHALGRVMLTTSALGGCGRPPKRRPGS